MHFGEIVTVHEIHYVRLSMLHCIGILLKYVSAFHTRDIFISSKCIVRDIQQKTRRLMLQETIWEVSHNLSAICKDSVWIGNNQVHVDFYARGYEAEAST